MLVHSRACYKLLPKLLVRSAVRLCSTPATDLVSLTTDNDGVAVMTMNRPPVNSLNLDLLTEMKIGIERVEDDQKVKGLIITSGMQKVFSAGLDIMEMHKPDETRLAAFWRTLQDVFMGLYGSSKPIVAAINGSSPAGGCLLSIACDSRVMAEGKFSIGLNETKLGIVAPFWFLDIFKQTVGHREAERGLQLGLLYSASDALRIGLVDELCPQEQVMSVAQQHLQKFIQIPGAARAFTKQQIRQPLLTNLEAKRDQDTEWFVAFVTNASVQANISKYLEMLKNKQRKD